MKIRVNGVVVEVDPNFSNLSPEDQAATVDEIARQMAATDQKDPNTKMGFLNKGIANVLGAPVDIVTSGLNAVGMDIQNPMGGSQSLASAMQAINADVSNRPPETLAEKGFQGAGEAAGMLLPIGAASNAMRTGSGVAAGVAQTVNQPFVSAPVRSTAAEIMSGAGASVAGELADRSAGGDAGPILRTAAEVAGGAATALAPAAAARTAAEVIKRTPVAGTAIRAVKSSLAPFTDAGAQIRAEQRVQSLVSDPQAAAAAMSGENPANLTPAQMSNDPGLLALERTASDEDPVLRDDLSARRQQSEQDINLSFRAPANGQSTANAVEFLSKRRDAFRKRIQGYADRARARADRRIEDLDPVRRETDNSIIVREEIDRAYNQAAEQEAHLWGKVPQNVRVQTVSSRERLAEIDADTGQAAKGDIPEQARVFLGESGVFGDEATVRDLHSLYSQMRQRAREASSGPAPNENRARIANEIADAILVDLGATTDLPTPVGMTINEARAFSRQMNEIFNQGNVGIVRGRERTGGNRVEPEATLSRTVGRGGANGAVAVDQIRRAAGQGADEATKDFLRGRLTDQAIRQGDYNPQAAENFVARNRETLQRFPDLQGQIGAANKATNTATARQARVDEIAKVLNNPRENAVDALIRATPGKEIAAAIFNTTNPQRAAASLARQARKDETGRALDGLKGGFLDHLMNRANRGFDGDGNPVASGNQLFGDLRDPQVRGVAAQIFSGPEVQRMETLARALQGVEGARTAKTLGAVIDDPPNNLVSLVMRTIAARQGAKAGQGTSGASLLTANFASKNMQRILDNLTNDRAYQLIQDAITDPEMMRALLTRNTSPNGAQIKAQQRITNWLMGVTGQEIGSLQEQ